MADKIKYPFLPEDKCLTEHQLFDYIDGKLNGNDMHHVEKHILSCGFCSDALEGLEKVKNRDKVAAFIPGTNSENKEEENKPKVISLHPNRKYYAMAAGLILIIAVTLFLKMSVTGDMENSKMAEMVQKDSSVAIMPSPEESSGTKMEDSISVSSSLNKTIVTNDKKPETFPLSRFDQTQDYYRNGPAADKDVKQDPNVSGESESQAIAGLDNNDMDGDGFVNIVDDVTLAEKSATDEYNKPENIQQKNEAKKAADKPKTKLLDREKNTPEKDNRDKIASGKERASTVEDVKAPVVVNGAAEAGVCCGTTVNTTSAPAGSGNYTYTVPTSTGSSQTVFADQSTVVLTDTVVSENAGVNTKGSAKDLDLSYENGVKMLDAGQASASLAFFDEVLKNPSHKYFQDAQWKKSQALIKLKRNTEAKALLQEIVKKGGKYKVQAEAELKKM